MKKYIKVSTAVACTALMATVNTMIIGKSGTPFWVGILVGTACLLIASKLLISAMEDK